MRRASSSLVSVPRASARASESVTRWPNTFFLDRARVDGVVQEISSRSGVQHCAAASSSAACVWFFSGSAADSPCSSPSTRLLGLHRVAAKHLVLERFSIETLRCPPRRRRVRRRPPRSTSSRFELAFHLSQGNAAPTPPSSPVSERVQRPRAPVHAYGVSRRRLELIPRGWDGDAALNRGREARAGVHAIDVERLFVGASSALVVIVVVSLCRVVVVDVRLASNSRASRRIRFSSAASSSESVSEIGSSPYIWSVSRSQRRRRPPDRPRFLRRIMRSITTSPPAVLSSPRFSPPVVSVSEVFATLLAFLVARLRSRG